MILKTLAFILMFYLLVRFISRLFMPSRSKRKSTARIIFQTFKDIQQHQQKQKPKDSQTRNGQEYFEEVEEAEFEDVTEEKSQTT